MKIILNKYFLKMIKKWFTLVELIVVIAILAILSTVAFISFQWYSQSSRDSIRLTDTKMIQKTLDLELTKNQVIPYPSDYITLRLDWVDIWYQWDAWINTLWKIWITQEVLDPLDKRFYTYGTNLKRTQYQILWFLEKNVNLSIRNYSYAMYEDRIPLLRWDEIWIIYDEIKQEPIHLSKVDVDITWNGNKYGLYLERWESKITNNDEQISSLLDFRVNKQWSCYNILKNWLSTWDWVYDIINKNWDTVQVYCNMSQQGWGWTLLIKADGNNTTFQYDSNLWTNSNTLNSWDLSIDKNEFKSELFSTQTLNEVLLVLDTQWIQKNLVFNKYASSLLEVFNSSYNPTYIGKNKWLNLVPESSLQPYCNQEWFNAYRVRLGISSNNENACSSNDSYIGIGLHERTSADRWYYSSVWNNCWSSLCSNWNKEVNSFWYVYIR